MSESAYLWRQAAELPDHEDWDEPMELGTTTHTARKPHLCIVCDGPISIGEQYTRRVFIWHGKFQIEKAHTDYELCAEIGEKVEAAIKVTG